MKRSQKVQVSLRWKAGFAVALHIELDSRQPKLPFPRVSLHIASFFRALFRSHSLNPRPFASLISLHIALFWLHATMPKLLVPLGICSSPRREQELQSLAIRVSAGIEQFLSPRAMQRNEKKRKEREKNNKRKVIRSFSLGKGRGIPFYISRSLIRVNLDYALYHPDLL